MPNTLTELMQTQILPPALKVLREACRMPMLVHSDFSGAAVEHKAVIRIPGPQNAGDADDMPTAIAAGGSSSTDLGDDKVDITMDQWKYKQFQMTDKEMAESVNNGILPSAAEAAVKSLANAVGNSLLELYKDIPYFFGDPSNSYARLADDIVGVRKVLEGNLCPEDMRRLLIDIDTEANLLVAFKDADKTGTTQALRNAVLGTLFGFDVYKDQLIGSHTAGTFAAGTPAVNGDVDAGATTMDINGGSASETIKAGDVFTVAGVPGQYVFTADKTATTGAITGATFSPAAPTGGFPTTSVITIMGSHKPSLAFHKNAFALAMRNLMSDELQSENSSIAAQVDPVSGLSLRLETWREPKLATRYWRFDVLYGVKTLRPELAARLIGSGTAKS